jgi:hypothetical protein
VRICHGPPLCGEELAVVFMAMAPGALRLRYRYVMQTLVLQAITD